MAFALAVGDLCSPAVVGPVIPGGVSFASTTEPPILGLVTKISPTVVLWQDGREVTYTPSTSGGNPDLGLGKVVVELDTPFQNAKVRPNGTIPNPNINGRANGVVVLVVRVTNAAVVDAQVAIIRFDNGLYTAVPTSAIEVIPGA